MRGAKKSSPHQYEAPRPGDRSALDRFRREKDTPDPQHGEDLLLRYLVENDYAEFARVLLKYVLIP